MPTKCPKCDSDNPSDSKSCKECGSQLTPSASIPDVTKTIETPVQKLTRGTLFADRYEIIEQLGIGGMRIVYRVEGTKAKATADEMQVVAEKALKLKKGRYSYYLMGMIELENNNFEKATEYFENAVSLMPHQVWDRHEQAFMISPLALAYYKSGQLEKSKEHYKKFLIL
jgi:tetratricopeptide (TPR) repeat protein